MFPPLPPLTPLTPFTPFTPRASMGQFADDRSRIRDSPQVPY